MEEEWTFKARFGDKSHMFVVNKHDPILFVRQEISRYFDLIPENIQMKVGYPSTQFEWNGQTRVHEVLSKRETILVQKGPSKFIKPINDFGEDESDRETWDDEDDDYSVHDSHITQEEFQREMEIRHEMERFLEQRRIRLARPRKMSNYLKIILEREHFVDQFYEANDIKQIIAFKLQLEYYYDKATAQYLGSIIGCFCGSEEFLKTLSDRERLDLHFFEVLDKNPNLENKKYLQLKREEMLEFVLENCKLASPPSICNKDRFYNEVEKRHDFGELVSRKTLEVDFGSFFLDSKLATTNTTDTASILRRKQYICLQFVEKEPKKEEVKHWVCQTCWWGKNKADESNCYICEKPKVASVARVPAVSKKQTILSSNTIADDDDLFNTTVQNSRDALEKTRTSKIGIANDAVDTKSTKVTGTPKALKKTFSFGSIFNWSKQKKEVKQETTKAENTSIDSDSIVPFDKFLNAYVLANTFRIDFDTIGQEARDLYNAVKSNSSLLLETFENMQRQASM